MNIIRKKKETQRSQGNGNAKDTREKENAKVAREKNRKDHKERNRKGRKEMET